MKHAKTEAGTRARRTLVQGAFAFGIIAVCGVITSVLGDASVDSLLNPAFWTTLGLLAAQAGITAVASYLQKNLEEREK